MVMVVVLLLLLPPTVQPEQQQHRSANAEVALRRRLRLLPSRRIHLPITVKACWAHQRQEKPGY